ncbi:MAG: transketolase [Christensenellaceae bacterium]|jgi:transketolase|nr:transketolase [Christensenellaceae bacterium]
MEKKCADFLRVNSLNMILNARSGHPGVCLGAADIIFSIFKNAQFNPKDPYDGRDRIVFSAGHASAIIYSVLKLFGYNYSFDDLKNFRQLGSKTTGHPERDIKDGIEITTGPLGQGVANAVGLALTERHLASKYNKAGLDIFNNYTYCFLGDGCLMEGVALEAISLAGNLRLNKLIMLYDQNNKTIDGKLNITNTEDTKKKFEACGFSVFELPHLSKVSDIDRMILEAKKSDKPSVIIIETYIGFGSELEDNEKSHGTPFTAGQVDFVKSRLGYNEPDFTLPKDVEKYVENLMRPKLKEYEVWQKKLERYKKEYPDEYKALNTKEVDLSGLIDKEITSKAYSTRDFSGIALDRIDKVVPNLIGGCADLVASTKAQIKAGGFIAPEAYGRQNIHFGIREHAMGAVCNGICAYGHMNVFCSTFFVFENYMTPAIRMAALMKLPVIYLFSHDSIAVGEDGPTHQPIEQIATLRAMPNMFLFRPCNFEELLYAFEFALNEKSPAAILTSRQILELINSNYADVKKGGYIISQAQNPKVTLAATGSEVGLALKIQEKLKEIKVSAQVVSLPCLEIFDMQTEEYKKKILCGKVFTLEAGSDNIWYKYTSPARVIKLSDFGKSGSAEDVARVMGFSLDEVFAKIKNNL